MMDFFTACANWAQRRAVVCVMERDEMDGWFARVELRDSEGTFSAIIDAVPRKGKHSKLKGLEPLEDYEDRVSELCEEAVARARDERNRRFSRVASQPRVEHTSA